MLDFFILIFMVFMNFPAFMLFIAFIVFMAFGAFMLGRFSAFGIVPAKKTSRYQAMDRED